MWLSVLTTFDTKLVFDLIEVDLILDLEVDVEFELELLDVEGLLKILVVVVLEGVLLAACVSILLT